MSNKFERSLPLRFIGSMSAFALLATLIYVFFVGFNLLSSLLLFSAFGSLAAQAIYVGGSFVEYIASFFEILVESISSIFEFIGSIFSF